MEGLEGGGEGGEKDDARKEEGDLAGPGALVEMGVVMLGEEGEGVGDGVGRRGGGRGDGSGAQDAASGGERGSDDAREAEEGEEVRDYEEEAAGRGAGAGLLAKT